MTATNGKQESPEEHAFRSFEQPVAADVTNKQRRTVIRKLAVGTAVLAGYSILPGKWTKPLVEFGSLPAHATTSGAVTTLRTADPAPRTATSGNGNFSLIFEMTYQSCASCGIWFDSAELVIIHSAGKFSKSQTGSLLIKKIPYRQGRFRADISSIPSSATIQSATLYMRLNRAEGIANSDSSSVIAVYDYSNGSKGPLVRKITASGDIKGKGYSKSNPTVPIDFTRFARKVQKK